MVAMPQLRQPPPPWPCGWVWPAFSSDWQASPGTKIKNIETASYKMFQAKAQHRGEGGWSWKVFQKKKIFFFQKTSKYYNLRRLIFRRLISRACPTPAIAVRPLAIFTITASTVDCHCHCLAWLHVANGARQGPWWMASGKWTICSVDTTHVAFAE